MNVYLKKQNLFWQKTLLQVGILILFIGFLNMFQAQIKNSFYLLSSPISTVFLRAGEDSTRFFDSIINFGGIAQENSNLKNENRELLSKVAALQGNLRENRQLQTALENTQEDHFEIALAGVVGLDSANDSIMINLGENDGIAENMPVISAQKVVYGKVVEVYADFSKVMLISSLKSTLNVEIQNTDSMTPSINGAVRGGGNFSAFLDLVNTDVKINEGDILETSGLEGVFPKDLLVGSIVSVDQNDLKAFQTAKLKLFLDMKTDQDLFVITNYKRQ